MWLPESTEPVDVLGVLQIVLGRAHSHQKERRMISVSSMHLNAAAEQSPSRASLGLLGVSLRHRIVAVVWLRAIRRRSLPRISLRFGIADRRRCRRNDRLVGYGHDFLLANRKNSRVLPFIQEVCGSLTVVDGDTVDEAGRTCGCWEGVPFVSGIDTPETHAKYVKERKLALVAEERPKELLAARSLKVMFSGVDLRMQRNERPVS